MIASLSKALSPRDRRALLWLGGIAVAALVFAFGVKPYFRSLADAREQLTAQRVLLSRERAILGASNRLPAALQRSRSVLAEQSTPLFEAFDELSATSDLSDNISQAALANEVLVQQIETRKGEPLEQGLVALAVDIRAEGDFEGVLHFLSTLERGEKLVRVSALTLSRVDRPATSGAPDMEVISLTGTMTGYAAFPMTTARLADTAPSPRGDRQ